MIINMNGAKAPETPSPVYQEKTVTPETLPTVIGPDEGYDGLSQVTVNPDAQLKSENIKYGQTVFGVVGSYGRQFVGGNIDVGGGAGVTSDKEFTFDVDFSEYPRQLTFNYPADIPQGMLLDPTTVKCNRPDFLIAARVPEHLIWMGVSGTAPWHMFNTQRGHKPDSFPYVITPLKEYRTMEDPINGTKMGRTFTMTYDQEVVNAPDNLTPENIKAGVTIAGIEGTYGPQPSEVTLETVVTTPVSFPTVVTPSAGYDGLSRVTVHSPDNLTAENIKAGVTIAGVTGAFEGAGSTVADLYRQIIAEKSSDSNPLQIIPEMFMSDTAIDPTGLFRGLYFNSIEITGVSNILSDDNKTGVFAYIRTFPSDGSWHGSVHIESTYGMNTSSYMFKEARLYELPTVKANGTRVTGVGMYYGVIFHPDNAVITIPDDMDLSSSIFYDCKTLTSDLNSYSALTIRFGSAYHGTIHGTRTIGTSRYPVHIIMECSTPPTMSGNGFESSGISEITVPKGSLEAYQTATNWSNYADKMVEATA